MKNNSKHLTSVTLATSLFAAITFFIIASSFSFLPQQKSGIIEGYVFPKEAGIRVELIISNPANASDTTMRRMEPDARGYYKFTNVPEGGYEIVFFPKNPNYISTSKPVNALAAKTASAGSITLKKLERKPLAKTE